MCIYKHTHKYIPTKTEVREIQYFLAIQLSMFNLNR